MQIVFRSTTSADAPAIVAFLSEVLGHDPDSAKFESRQLHWKYWQERPDWQGPRSFVLTHDAAVLAHAAILPGSCAWRGGRFRTLHLIDWAARPDAVGAGSTLLKRLGQMTDALLAIGGSARTQSLLPALGFRQLSDCIGYARCVRPLRRLTEASQPNWRLPHQFARSILWTVLASSTYEGEWQVRRIAPEDVERADLPLPTPGPGTAIFERNAAVFRYLLACPAAPMTLHQISRVGGRTRGYFVLAFAPGQARLADCWVDSTDPGDWRALIQLAVHVAMEDQRIAEVVARSSDPALSAILAACGFHARTFEPVQLLTMPGVDLRAERIRVQMLDNDAAWLHAGHTEFWV